MSTSNKVISLHRHRQPKPVKVIAITGGKGGVGKTTLSANLALALSAIGRRVLLLDGDLGLANAHLMFGVRPQYTLRDLVRGKRELHEIIGSGPEGLRLIAGANGFADMSQLSAAEHAGIVNAFSRLQESIDVMVVDTAPGISGDVLQFAGSASHPVVVLRDEPASIADAYAIIKLLHQSKGVEFVRVITNMSAHDDGCRVFDKLRRTVEKFLSVTLLHVGSIPYDEKMIRSVRRYQPLISAFPRCHAALAIRRLAARADSWSTPISPSGRQEFFLERLLQIPVEAGAR